MSTANVLLRSSSGTTLQKLFWTNVDLLRSRGEVEEEEQEEEEEEAWGEGGCGRGGDVPG